MAKRCEASSWRGPLGEEEEEEGGYIGIELWGDGFDEQDLKENEYHRRKQEPPCDPAPPPTTVLKRRHISTEGTVHLHCGPRTIFFSFLLPAVPLLTSPFSRSTYVLLETVPPSSSSSSSTKPRILRFPTIETSTPPPPPPPPPPPLPPTPEPWGFLFSKTPPPPPPLSLSLLRKTLTI